MFHNKVISHIQTKVLLKRRKLKVSNNIFNKIVSSFVFLFCYAFKIPTVSTESDDAVKNIVAKYSQAIWIINQIYPNNMYRGDMLDFSSEITLSNIVQKNKM